MKQFIGLCVFGILAASCNEFVSSDERNARAFVATRMAVLTPTDGRYRVKSFGGPIDAKVSESLPVDCVDIAPNLSRCIGSSKRPDGGIQIDLWNGKSRITLATVRAGQSWASSWLGPNSDHILLRVGEKLVLVCDDDIVTLATGVVDYSVSGSSVLALVNEGYKCRVRCVFGKCARSDSIAMFCSAKIVATSSDHVVVFKTEGERYVTAYVADLASGTSHPVRFTPGVIFDSIPVRGTSRIVLVRATNAERLDGTTIDEMTVWNIDDGTERRIWTGYSGDRLVELPNNASRLYCESAAAAGQLHRRIANEPNSASRFR